MAFAVTTVASWVNTLSEKNIGTALALLILALLPLKPETLCAIALEVYRAVALAKPPACLLSASQAAKISQPTGVS